MKTYRYRAFTLVEIMTVMVIIAILVGILMPALNQVKKLAKETRQKAQIGSIDIAINLYKNDFGEYPPSHGNGDSNNLLTYNYCGTQTLAEAMFGQDLLGFHPDSQYDPCEVCYTTGTLGARKDAYLDRTNISVFTPSQIFNRDTYAGILKVAPSKYVICDVFTAVSRQINGRTYKIGTPVLYFRANPSALNTQLISDAGGDPANLKNNIYNWRDNYSLTSPLFGSVAGGKPHPIWTINGDNFYDFIRDPMILTLRRPVRLDSFLLISAGSDGLYGTHDDICNFDPNLPG